MLPSAESLRAYTAYILLVPPAVTTGTLWPAGRLSFGAIADGYLSIHSLLYCREPVSHSTDSLGHSFTDLSN